jgi:amino acid transporter
MFWDWIGTFFMTLIVVSGMAEICSAYPNAGSVYYWAGNVAPRKWAAFASYWAGLWNLLGYVAVGAYYSYTFASFLNTALQYSGLSQLSEDYEVAIALAAAVVNLGLNCMRVDHVGYIANFAAVMQFGFVVAIVIVLFVMTPSFNSSEFVFFDYVNDTGFSSKSYVISVSLLFPIFAAFCAYDVSAHIAEETKSLAFKHPWPSIIPSYCLALSHSCLSWHCCTLFKTLMMLLMQTMRPSKLFIKLRI